MMSASDVFGELKPKNVGDQFTMKKAFSKGEDAQSYIEEPERGSSEKWEDSREFATPDINDRHNKDYSYSILGQSSDKKREISVNLLSEIGLKSPLL